MNNKLKIVYLKVNEEPKIIEIEDTLEAKQKLVGGLIEIVPFRRGIDLICNEEGKIYNLRPNLFFKEDYIAGDCFFIGDDGISENFVSLTDEQIKRVLNEIPRYQFKYEYKIKRIENEL